MTENSEIEFMPWETPFKDTRNGISGATYVGSDAANTEKNWDLEVKVYDYDNDINYSVSFEDVSGFRILDEHGLDELWGSPKKRPSRSTFKVRNHAWHKESPATFFFGHHPDGEYSYIIATDWDCVEVVCKNEPIIQIEKTK